MNPFFPLFAIVCIMIFGFLFLVIGPITFLISQNAVHRCSRCLHVMGVKRCFGIPDDLSAPVWHIKLGKCAVVIGRVWAILILIAFSILSIFYVYQRPYQVRHSFFERPQ